MRVSYGFYGWALRVGSAAAGGRGAALLVRLPGDHRRPLGTSPNLSLRCSHGSDGRWTSWRGSLLAEKLPPFRLRFRLLVFRVGQPHITSKDFADPGRWTHPTPW